MTGLDVLVARKKLKMNQIEFAKALGVSRWTVSYWESERQDLELSKWANKKVEAFLGEEHGNTRSKR